MPISENELMWSTAGAEELSAETGGRGVDATDVEPTVAPGEAHSPELRTPLLPTDAASRLEATLARLEMSSLEMKLYLDAIEQRISRMEPFLQALPRESSSSRSERVSDSPHATETRLFAREARLPEAKLEPEAGRGIGEAPGPGSLSAPSGTPGMAKEGRWTHLVGHDREEVRVSEPVQASRPLPSHRLPDEEVPGRAAGTLGTLPGGREDRWSQMLDRESATRLPAAPEEDRSEADARSGRLTGLESVSGSEESWDLLSLEEMEAAAREGERAAELFRRRAEAADEQRAAETGGSPVSTEVADVTEVLPYSDENPADVAGLNDRAPAPRMWRGYRVFHLVLGAILLVLGAIPAVLWWQASTASHSADGADAPAVSIPEGATNGDATSARGERKSALPTPKRPETAVASNKGLSVGAVDGGGQGRGQSAVSGTAQPLGMAAPVIRRQPAPAVAASEGAPSPVARAGAGTSAPAIAGRDVSDERKGEDVVGGSSAHRVRVPSDVMSARLLPVDVAASGGVAEMPHEQGEVEVVLFISNTGRVEEVQVVSGQRSLREPALRAIRNWRYEPYVQDGVRVPVVTTASLRFNGGQ